MKKVKILLVEDNEGDILLTKEAFEEARIINDLSVAKNGKEALDYIFRRGRYTDAEKPDLILLDINLPVKSGHEVLAEIKNHPDTKRIPVVMLTTSDSKKDIEKAYGNYANCYISKPVEIENFMEAMQKVEDFWFQLVKLAGE